MPPQTNTYAALGKVHQRCAPHSALRSARAGEQELKVRWARQYNSEVDRLQTSLRHRGRLICSAVSGLQPWQVEKANVAAIISELPEKAAGPHAIRASCVKKNLQS